jgi:hypothetical protein
MQLNSHKAFTLWVPLLGMVWLADVVVAAADVGGGVQTTWGQRALRGLWGAGLLGVAVVVAVAVGVLPFVATGTFHAYVDDVRLFFGYANVSQVSSSPALLHYAASRSLSHTVLSLCAPAVAVITWRERGLQAAWPAIVAATALILGLALIGLSPAPFPYNLIWLTAPVGVAVVVSADAFIDRTPARWRPAWLLVPVLILVQFASHAVEERYVTVRWHGQLDTADAVEAATDVSDPVLDGMGLVVTRPPPAKDWLLHYVLMPAYREGKRQHFKDIIATTAPPVLIKVPYRFSWLDDDDAAAIAANYLFVAPHVGVLQATVVDEAGTLRIVRPGRYLFASRCSVVTAGVLDDGPVTLNTVMAFTAGPHPVRVPCGATALWVGPHLDGVPQPPVLKRIVQKPNLPGVRTPQPDD